MSRTWNLFLRYLIALCDAIMNTHPQQCDILLHKKSVWRLWFARGIRNDDRNQVFFLLMAREEEKFNFLIRKQVEGFLCAIKNLFFSWRF